MPLTPLQVPCPPLLAWAWIVSLNPLGDIPYGAPSIALIFTYPNSFEE